MRLLKMSRYLSTVVYFVLLCVKNMGRHCCNRNELMRINFELRIRFWFSFKKISEATIFFKCASFVAK